MSGFSESWLALREPADARARDPELLERLAAWARSRPDVEVHDLGCGSGANLRLLAPLLGPGQRWRLYDHDPALLAALPAVLAAWAATSGADFAVKGEDLLLTGSGWSATAVKQRCDLAGGLDRLRSGAGGLVTGSALLDLVSESWLAGLFRLPAHLYYFPLVVDGRRSLEPSQPQDDAVLACFAAHQQKEKGFGPALGAKAPAAFLALARSAGHRALARRSDWRLGTDDSALQRALIEELAFRATEALGDRGAAAWRVRHLNALEAGESRILVGHRDLLAWRP